MLYYLSTEELDERNQLFRKHLQKLKSGMAEYIRKGLPASMENDDKVKQCLSDLETRMLMALMDTDEDLNPPMLFCGMSRKGIRWNTLIGLPQGKKLVIIDEDGDKYSLDEFDELAGETCELTAVDEKTLFNMRASQNEPESDKYRIYMPEMEI